MSARSVDALVAEARSRIARLAPAHAWEEVSSGRAVLVDIRSSEGRAQDGIVPGSVHIPRTVLEWRLDPTSLFHNPHVAGTERRVVVFCDHGSSSSFAAAALADLGYRDVADVDGGVEAWRAAGLPLRDAEDVPLGPGELPGMRGPVPL